MTGPVIDLATLALPPEWTEHALCAQVDLDGFFPEGRGASAGLAKKTCAMCPVISKCLDWAVKNDEPHGVWGGLSPRQRRPLVNAYRASLQVVCELEECEVVVDQTERKRRYCSHDCAARAASRRFDRKAS